MSTNNKCSKWKKKKKRNVGENANWYSHYGEQYGGSLKN